LIELLKSEVQQPVTAGAHLLASAIRRRHSGAVVAVLFYGSCLRRQSDEGLLDLYALVDDYRNVYRNRLWAFLNALLPPNVFYLEVPIESGALRAKYAVLSMRDFLRYNSVRCFQSYFWGRFAQPIALLHVADDLVRDRVLLGLASAVETFVSHALLLQPRRFRVGELWVRGLTESYATELRSERSGNPKQVYEADSRRYELVTEAALRSLPFPFRIETLEGEMWVEVDLPETLRASAPRSWRIRRVQGKLFSLLRLLKGFFTFAGGVDYVLWKIERHSGVKVDSTWRQRRSKWLALGAEFWRLYRRRAFR
jgi:hypothetical protein